MKILHHLLAESTPGTTHRLTSLHFGTPGGGPKAYIQASLHADEVPAMLVAWHLRRHLEALDAAGRLQGEVVLVPAANPIGLAQFALEASRRAARCAALDVHARSTQQHGDGRKQAPADDQRRCARHHGLTPRRDGDIPNRSAGAVVDLSFREGFFEERLRLRLQVFDGHLRCPIKSSTRQAPLRPAGCCLAGTWITQNFATANPREHLFAPASQRPFNRSLSR